MKNFILIIGLIFFHSASFGQQKAILDSVKVKISCGQCNFKMEGNSCDLAIKYKRHYYFVDGSTIDDHGDAHGADGFCSKVREAYVSGKIEESRFSATKIELVPIQNKEK